MQVQRLYLYLLQIQNHFIQNYVKKDAGKRSLKEYKTVELYVGYKEIDDKNIYYCMKIMEQYQRSNDTIQKFNHDSEEEEKYNETNIFKG